MSRPARQWWATPAVNAPYFRHLMPSANPLPEGSATAICGEYHRRWQRVQEFARPQVFEVCPSCLTRATQGG